MAHEETVNTIELSDNNMAMVMTMTKTIEQQLTDANDEITELKMQIAWLERSYE